MVVGLNKAFSDLFTPLKQPHLLGVAVKKYQLTTFFLNRYIKPASSKPAGLASAMNLLGVGVKNTPFFVFSGRGGQKQAIENT